MTQTHIVQIQGLSFKVRDGSWDEAIVRDVIEGNPYAPLLEQTEPGCIYLDIGSHIGAFAILAASRGARVFAFEPIPANYALVVENIALNGLSDRVTAFNQGVWSRDTQRRITFSDENTGGGGMCWPDSPGMLTVDCVGLRDFLGRAQVDHYRGMKLDCEGAEFEILHSLSSHDLQRFDMISMEYHTLFGSLPDLMAHLQAAGFATRQVAVTDELGFAHAIRDRYVLDTVEKTLERLQQRQLKVAFDLSESRYMRLPIIGPIWRRLRRGAHELVVHYLNQIADQQNGINRDISHVLTALYRGQVSSAERAESKNGKALSE